MKQRIVLLVIGVLGLCLGLVYFLDFLNQHPTFNLHLDARFYLLILPAVCLQLLAHLGRAYKSHLLIDKIRPSKTATLFKGVSIGLLFNSILPLRLGELVRAYYLGDALAVSRTSMFMSIIIERIFDGAVLGASLVSAGLLIGPGPASTAIGSFGAAVLVVTLLLLCALIVLRSENRYLLRFLHSATGIFNDRLSSRMRFIAWSGIYGTKLMTSSARDLRRYSVATLLVWECYFASTALVGLAFFGELPFKQLWLAMQSVYAGITAPAGPGYLGTFHLTVSDILSKAGIAAGEGYSLLAWITITVPISAVGLIVLLRQRFGEKKQVSSQEALINKLHREKDISTELTHFLDAYLKGDHINKLLTNAELSDTYRLIKALKGGSNASTMLVWQQGELRVKKITLPQFAEKLKEQADWIRQRSSLKHVPVLLAEEHSNAYYSFDLQYQETYLPFFDYIHSHSTADSGKVLRNIVSFVQKSIHNPAPARNGEQQVLDYIAGKVFGKVNDTAAVSTTINQLFQFDALLVNGLEYDNLATVMDRIRHNKAAMQDLSGYQESPIHGDLTVDNLIVSPSGDYVLLDPNNENQVSTPTVDYGKLYQSLHSGYEFLIQLDSCVVSADSVSFEDAKSHKYNELFQTMDTMLKKQLPTAEYRTILFHEAVHYCRMLTYRASINPQTVAVFYATAVKLFNDFLAQYPRHTRS